MGLLGSLFGAIFSGGNNNSDVDDCDWYCDQCNTLLNVQPGFTTVTGSWTCAECGFENDVTSGNIISDDEDYSDLSSGFNDIECFSNGDTCTNCGWSLDGAPYYAPWEDGDNPYEYVICPHCNAKNNLDFN